MKRLLLCMRADVTMLHDTLFDTCMTFGMYLYHSETSDSLRGDQEPNAYGEVPFGVRISQRQPEGTVLF